MTGITASGLGSGMDISSLVSQLVAAERSPATSRLDSRETKLKAQISAIGSFKSVLSNFQSSLASLKKTETFQSMKATVADDKLFAATAENGAQAGDYNIKVEQLAQAHRLATPADQVFASTSAVIGTGTLTFQFGTYDADTNAFTANADKSIQTVTLDASNNTLTGIRDAINKANIGVTASIVNDGNGYRLVMGAKDSGAANGLKITADDSSLSLLAFDPTSQSDRDTKQTLAAADARIVVDGLTVTSASNTVKEVVPGVTLTLKAKGDTATNLTVAQDTSETTKALETFVKSYNDMMNTVKSLTAYDTQTKTAGTLAGDYNVRSTINRIRDIFTSSITGASGSFKSLADVGISLQRDGTLNLDSTKLANALGSDTEGVASLFAHAGGTTDPLIRYVDSTSTATSGTFDITVSQLATQGSYVGNSISSLTLVGSSNTFALKVDGVQSGTLELLAGTYTSDQLVSELQSRINGDSALQAAGASVSVGFSANAFTFTSNRYGSSSSIEFTAVNGGIGNRLKLSVGAGTVGQDAQGTIDGVAATGSGRTLTATSGSAAGISVEVLGGATGTRGTVSLSDGIAQRLDNLLTDVLGSDGPLNSRTETLNKQVDQVGDERDKLDIRMSALEARYQAQFTAMDLLVSQLTATSNYLTQQLAGLSSSS